MHDAQAIRLVPKSKTFGDRLPVFVRELSPLVYKRLLLLQSVGSQGWPDAALPVLCEVLSLRFPTAKVIRYGEFTFSF